MNWLVMLFVAAAVSVLSGIMGYVYCVSEDAFFLGITITLSLYSIGTWVFSAVMLIAEETPKKI